MKFLSYQQFSTRLENLDQPTDEVSDEIGLSNLLSSPWMYSHLYWENKNMYILGPQLSRRNRSVLFSEESYLSFPVAKAFPNDRVLKVQPRDTDLYFSFSNLTQTTIFLLNYMTTGSRPRFAIGFLPKDQLVEMKTYDQPLGRYKRQTVYKTNRAYGSGTVLVPESTNALLIPEGRIVFTIPSAAEIESFGRS